MISALRQTQATSQARDFSACGAGKSTSKPTRGSNIESLSQASSFAELVDLYGDSIYKFCRSLAYSKEEAEDLFQETFLKALQQSSKTKAAKNPQGFLFSVAAYLWKSWKRKHARRDRIAPFQPFDENLLYNSDMEYDFITREDGQIVRAVVEDLPEKFKIPILLHYSVGLGLTDIAAALEIPAGTVKSRLFKARKLIEKGLILNGYQP